METRERKIYRITLVGSFVNFLLLTFKFIAGILGHSAAMIADAVHSFSDFATDVVVLVLVKISSKPEDEDHGYGHGRYETLASQIIGIALAGVGVMIGWNGIVKIWGVIHGETLESPGYIALIAAVVSIISKEIIFRCTMKVAKEVESPAVEANAWHHRSDALSSIGTALGIGGAVLLGDKWAVLDPIAAVIVSVFIIGTAWKLIREASSELLDKSLSEDIKARIKEIVYEDEDVSDVHHLRTRKMGSRSIIEMHIRMPGEISLTEAHNHASSIEKRLRNELGENTHIMLHLEPVKENK